MDTIVNAFNLWGKYGPLLGILLIVVYSGIAIHNWIKVIRYNKHNTEDENHEKRKDMADN